MTDTSTQTDREKWIAHHTGRSPSAAPSVLIVDDEPTMRLLLRVAMQKEGLEVIEASNGVECLEIFEQQQPDIVLLDAIMPEMDGFSCCTALQKLPLKNPPPVLMITSLDDSKSVDHVFEVGATDYIAKPIHWALLRQRVRRLQDMLNHQQAEEQIKASLKEKEALLKEVHHRVKNNLQIISSLLNLQSGSIKDPHIVDLFRQSQNRVRLMALVHEKLYQTDDLGKINLREYIQVLSSYLMRSYEVNPKSIDLIVEIDDIFLEIDTAVSCGLIINELTSNSLKYAFSDGRDGIIEIRAETTDENAFFISYRDNGVGLPENFNIDETETLGLQLISSLTEQLGGNLDVISHSGAQFKLTNLLLSQ
ncbi:MAG: histidine kinase dimerization/phosphoacceptor domain -containing protein [Phormidesmis sp.]